MVWTEDFRRRSRADTANGDDVEELMDATIARFVR